MKAFLFVLLLAVIFCETLKKDTVDVVTCLLRSDVIFKALADIVEAVKNGKDIINVLLKYFYPVKLEIDKCLA